MTVAKATAVATGNTLRCMSEPDFWISKPGQAFKVRIMKPLIIAAQASADAQAPCNTLRCACERIVKQRPSILSQTAWQAQRPCAIRCEHAQTHAQWKQKSVHNIVSTDDKPHFLQVLIADNTLACMVGESVL